MPPDRRNLPKGSIARKEAIPVRRNSPRDHSPRRKPSRRGVDLDKLEGSTGSNSRCDRKLFMQYSPDRDPRRMDLPKYPTYWPGSDSPPLLTIHRRLKSITEPPPEREVSSNESWVPKGSYSPTDIGSPDRKIPGCSPVWEDPVDGGHSLYGSNSKEASPPETDDSNARRNPPDRGNIASVTNILPEAIPAGSDHRLR